MTHERTTAGLRGFAGMDADKRRAIAKKGGASVPREKRSFVQNWHSPLMQGVREGSPFRQRRAASLSIATWRPKRVAKVVRLAKLNADDA